MKNYEKYSEQLKHLRFAEDCNVAYKKMKKSSCLYDGMHCGGCEFRSVEAFLKFMNEEYKEPCPLSHEEYVILKNLPSDYEWIARYESGHLAVYFKKPIKFTSQWGNAMFHDFPFKKLFQFIKWEDEEPYSIKQLIVDYEKEHEND